MTTNFTCPRTCAFLQLCRFQPILSAIGNAGVYSHTVRVKVEYDYANPDALRRAVENMGGIWYGLSKAHDLYDTKQEGYGFILPFANSSAHSARMIDGKPFWHHPIVLRADGELAYDDYGGMWGDKAQLETLRAEYAFAKAEVAAQNLGWQTERTPAGLTVYHPEGGRLDLSKSMLCETTGFVGSGCHDARLALGLPADGAPTNKLEHDQTSARINLPSS